MKFPAIAMTILAILIGAASRFLFAHLPIIMAATGSAALYAAYAVTFVHYRKNLGEK